MYKCSECDFKNECRMQRADKVQAYCKSRNTFIKEARTVEIYGESLKTVVPKLESSIEFEPEPIKTFGLKYDQGKRDWLLLPFKPLEEIVKVLEFGEKKYGRDNWKLVEKSEIRYLNAAFRHLIAYSTGEKNDTESGLSHLAHAATCILFLLEGK